MFKIFFNIQHSEDMNNREIRKLKPVTLTVVVVLASTLSTASLLIGFSASND